MPEQKGAEGQLSVCYMHRQWIAIESVIGRNYRETRTEYGTIWQFRSIHLYACILPVCLMRAVSA